MLIGSVPPSGLIKLPFWERESTLRTSHLIRSINVLCLTMGDDQKLGHSIPNHKIDNFRNIHTHKNYTLLKSCIRWSDVMAWRNQILINSNNFILYTAVSKKRFIAVHIFGHFVDCSAGRQAAKLRNYFNSLLIGVSELNFNVFRLIECFLTHYV